MRWRGPIVRTMTLLVTTALATATCAAAAASRGAGPTPPRLSFLDGEVSFWRPGAEDWAPAQVNTPLAEGDSLYTGDNANLEVQIGPQTFVRAGAGTELSVESLDPDLTQLKVTSGRVAVDAERLPRGRAIELDTPSGAFTIDGPGYYRTDVDDQRTTFVAREGGRASVVPANGEATDVPADRQLVLTGTGTPEISTNAAPDPDEWDRWNLDRTATLERPSPSSNYVPADVAGTRDLDRYGRWQQAPQYGPVWVPSSVPSGWAPYSTGRWIWDPYYGWTWVDDAPWGWAPYHYGRWVFLDGYWGWAPGPVVAAPVYAPALVAFVGPSVSVSVGLPYVGWVALGWGEPCIPWWGPVGFAGTAWWGGWGGPHVVNNVVVERNTFVNVRNINVYRNAKVQNAVVAVHRNQFGHGRVEHVRVPDVRHLQPIRGHVPVRPTPASLAPREGRGRPAPEPIHTRPVVATRAPHDPSPRLERAGLKPSSQPTAPPPRVVEAPRPPAPEGRAHVARQAPERRGATNVAAPPPPRRGDQPDVAPQEHATPPTSRAAQANSDRGHEGHASAPQQPGHQGKRGPSQAPRAPVYGAPSARPPAQPYPPRDGGVHGPEGVPPPHAAQPHRAPSPQKAPRHAPPPAQTSRAPGWSVGARQARPRRAERS
jgi:hypothetical protein